MNLHLLKIKQISLSLFIASIFLLSCSKKENNQNLNGNVSFSVSDINLLPENSATIMNNTSSLKHKTEVSTIIENFDNFSWELSTETDDNTQSLTKSTNLTNEHDGIKGNVAKNSAKTPMALGKKYMLLIYKVNNGEEVYYTRAEVTVGQADFSLTLPPASGRYNWYAYSYNETTSLPLPANLNNPEIPNKTSAPLLFSSGNFNLQNTDVRVPISFKHQTPKIELVLDGQPMFANSFQRLNVDFNNLSLTTQNYNLRTQKPTGNVLTTTNINNLNIIFQNHQGFTSKRASTNLLYTSNINPSINIRVKEIVIIQTGVQKVILAANEPNKLASFSNFSTANNTVKRAVVTLKYKGGNISPNEWAQGNLYYDETDPSNPYKFADPVFMAQAEACNYYWNFNTLLPRSRTGNRLTPIGDPCKEVLPKGSWRTPSLNDFATLNIANRGVGYVYFDAANGERVYFNEAGWITTNNGCSVNNTNDGQYWSTNASNRDDANQLEIDERGGAGAGNRIYSRPKTYGLSIRCVRSL